MINKAIHIMNILDNAGYTEIKSAIQMVRTKTPKSYALIPLMRRINFVKCQADENGGNGWKYHIRLETDELYEWKHYTGEHDLDYWEWELIGTVSDPLIEQLIKAQS